MNINRTAPSSLPVTLQFGGRQPRTPHSSVASHHRPIGRTGPNDPEDTLPSSPGKHFHRGLAGALHVGKRFTGNA
jgi:hypothetical protein